MAILNSLWTRIFSYFLAFIRRSPPLRLINHLLAFFAWRWTRTTPRNPTLRHCQEPPASSTTLDAAVVCAMSDPSPGPSDTPSHEDGRLSQAAVDLRYANERSLSGGHLIPPPPALARHFSRDRTSWVPGSQPSVQDEPVSIDYTIHRSSQGMANSIVRPSSRATMHSHYGNQSPKSDTYLMPTTSRPPSPLQLHRVVSGTSMASTSAGSPVVKSFPNVTSSSLSVVSGGSHNSRKSIGRASYREYRGSIRIRASVSDLAVGHVVGSSSPTQGGAEPDDSAAFEICVALPRDGHPSIPGEPMLLDLFLPTSVNGLLRYENRETRLPFGRDYTIEAMSHKYPETPPEVPEGWTAYRHPEGAIYYVHRQSKTFTEVNICNEQIHGDIEYFRKTLLSKLEAEIKTRVLSESLKVDELQLVLEPKVLDGHVMCCYYFVNPPARSLFWLQDWEGEDVFGDCKGIISPAHKGLAIQAHYWRHCDHFPNFLKITKELKDEVIDMILHATCDHLSSTRSSCPLNAEELKSYLSLVREIDPKRTETRKHCVIIIGRVMHTFYHNYFLHFYGEECARLNFDQSVHGWEYQPSLLMTLFSPLLFMAHVNNTRLLHKIYVDDIASKEKWHMFITRLNSQLQDTSLLATVLMNANVSFLQIQSMMPNSAQQFLINMSLVASLASIVLGLIFIGQTRIDERNTPLETAKFLHGLWHEKHGLEKLAIIYSLPQTLLMWGMVLFFAGAAFQWCSPERTSLRFSAVGFMIAVVLLVMWCIWTARGHSRVDLFQVKTADFTRQVSGFGPRVRMLVTSFIRSPARPDSEEDAITMDNLPL